VETLPFLLPAKNLVEAELENNRRTTIMLTKVPLHNQLHQKHWNDKAEWKGGRQCHLMTQQILPLITEIHQDLRRNANEDKEAR
jgi:hypothetical protein